MQECAVCGEEFSTALIDAGFAPERCVCLACLVSGLDKAKEGE